MNNQYHSSKQKNTIKLGYSGNVSHISLLLHIQRVVVIFLEPILFRKWLMNQSGLLGLRNSPQFIAFVELWVLTVLSYDSVIKYILQMIRFVEICDLHSKKSAIGL